MIKNNIDSYDSRYPSAYYEIGEVYAFYNNRKSVNFKPVDDEIINKYSKKLLELQKDDLTSSDKQGVNDEKRISAIKLNRCYGVVVEKQNSNCIVVLMLNVQNGVNQFYIQKYAVGYGGCLTDGKELVEPSVSTSINASSVSKNKVGGITRNSKSEYNIGGITKVKQNETVNSAIGGITRQNKSETSNNNIGGITRINKVGGITRVKK